MAGAIGVAALLARMVKITCPYCKSSKLVLREPVKFRVCSSCRKHFPDPKTKKTK